MKDEYSYIRIQNNQQWQEMGASLWGCWHSVINQWPDQSQLTLLPLSEEKKVYSITYLSLSKQLFILKQWIFIFKVMVFPFSSSAYEAYDALTE